MRVVFFGNTKYSVIVAKVLYNEHGLSSIVTIPDRPLGRKKVLTPSPVKQFALENNVPSLEFNKLDKLAVEKIVKLQPDFLVVADYGLILPKAILELPKYAPINVHHSLLPKYRGPSPAPAAILNGNKVSGVTIIKMVDKVDAGPILAQKEYELKPYETTDSLLTTLNTIGGELVVDVIKNYTTTKPVVQDETRASMSKQMTKQDGFIDLNKPPSAEKLDRMIRAYYPWPTVWSNINMRGRQKTIKLLPKEVLPQKASPFEAKEFFVGVAIQVEGGKPMTLKDFLNGYPQLKNIIDKLFTTS